jgi:hypothetical protein
MPRNANKKGGRVTTKMGQRLVIMQTAREAIGPAVPIQEHEKNDTAHVDIL